MNRAKYFNLKNFKLGELIGSGAFGDVYKVQDKRKHKIYAAKILKRNIEELSKDHIRSITREVNIMSKLKHPSIVELIGFSPVDFEGNSQPVIVTELMKEGTLTRLIELERSSLSDPRWDETRKLIVLYGIASAMLFLHDHNIIHRDLKPDNILMDEDLYPKISDFGLSKIEHKSQESMSLQSTAGTKGTPLYLAPEAISNSIYSKPGDVYSFAFIAYEILTNEIPFLGINLYTLIDYITSGKRPEFKSPINEPYKKLIEKCWSQEPEKRPTFEEIVKELEKPEFITDSIDSSQFENYADYIKNYTKIFNKTNKIVSFDEYNLIKAQKVDEKNDFIQEDENIVDYFTPEIKREAFDWIKKFLNQPNITDELLNKKLYSLIVDNKNFYKLDIDDDDYFSIDEDGGSCFMAEDFITKEKACILQMKSIITIGDELHIILENNDLRFLKLILLQMFCKHPTLNDILGYNICDPYKYILYDEEEDNENKDTELNEIEKYPSILFDYVENKTLNYYVENGKIFELTPLQRQIIIIGLVALVRFFHKHDIVLFTLSPEMIGLDENFYPKTLNLHNLSNKEPKNWGKYKFGLHILKHSYCTFFPIYSDSISLGISDDIPVLGANLYLLITGVIPFKHRKDALRRTKGFSLLNKIKEGSRPFIPENVSGTIRDLLTRCWSIDPKERPTADYIYDRLKNSFDYYIEGLKPVDVFAIFEYFKLIETYENHTIDDLFNEDEYSS